MKKGKITADNKKGASKENDFKNKEPTEAPGKTDQTLLSLSFLVIILRKSNVK